MASVTHVISQTKQPRGGYLNPKDLVCIQKANEEELYDISLENISPGLVGTVVDYMTRFMLNGSLDKSFFIARLGARIIGFEDYFQGLLEEIKGLDNRSIFKAVKCASFDSVYRGGIIAYKNVEDINPDEVTISNIRIMIERSLDFFNEYGPIISDGFTFEGAYTDKVDTGDGDFLTKDTLWDFKVSKNDPTSKNTLQLLMYYLMGKKTGKKKFQFISKIGFFNPRLNRIYFCKIDDVPTSILEEIKNDVIGYKNG